MLSFFRASFVSFLFCISLCVFTGCEYSPQTSFQGYVEGEYVYVATSQAGRLEQLAVKRGDEVTKGLMLFQLEPEPEQAAFIQSEKQLDAARSLLEDLKTGRRPLEIAVIEEQLSQAQTAARQSRSQLERSIKLFQSRTISQEELEMIEANAKVDASRVDELNRQLDVARLAGREDQIQAQFANVEAAQALWEQAKWRLEQKTVAAPVDGIVFDTFYRKGEWVVPGYPVLQILPPENVKVRFFVPEILIGTFTKNQNVWILFDGAPAPVPMTITFISPQAEYTPPVIYSNETRSKLVFMLEAHPTPEAAKINLHPGMPVEVRINTPD